MGLRRYLFAVAVILMLVSVAKQNAQRAAVLQAVLHGIGLAQTLYADKHNGQIAGSIQQLIDSDCWLLNRRRSLAPLHCENTCPLPHYEYDFSGIAVRDFDKPICLGQEGQSSRGTECSVRIRPNQAGL